MSNEQNIKENQQIIKDTIKHLAQRIINVANIEFNEEQLGRRFSIADIREPRHELEPWLDSLRDSESLPALYVIEAENPDLATKLLEGFDAANARSAEERGYNLSQRNDANAMDGATVLYVGKAEKNIRKHLRLHLLKTENKTTSALHLGHWVPDIEGTPGGTLRVDVRTILGDPGSQDVKDALKDIEDAQWLSRRPMFGKRGGN